MKIEGAALSIGESVSSAKKKFYNACQFVRFGACKNCFVQWRQKQER